MTARQFLIVVALLFTIGVAVSLSGLAGDTSLDSVAKTANDVHFDKATQHEKQYQFCFWNVENLFDDKDDRRREVDEEYDNPFARDSKLRQLKLDRIAEALLRLNDRRGPDIIAAAEVESVRAGDLLRATLNRKLKEQKQPASLNYTQLSMKNIGPNAGRHISTAVISRIPIVHAKTRSHGRNLRILETHLLLNNQELCIISSHWTSQLSQEGGGNGERGRNRYATTIREIYQRMLKQNPEADCLVCGDFNDRPEAESITQELGTVSDRQLLIKSASSPKLLNLLANKPRESFGTIWYNGQPMIYDQICISRGLLDTQGWSCDPESVKTQTAGLIQKGSRRRQPWRYGDPANTPIGGRGYSDHFPVTLQLTVFTPKPE